jgi:tRNA wybutosine-synthesizing protein 2
MLCVKLKRKDLGLFPRNLINTDYEFVFLGDYVLIPVKERAEGYTIEECNPPLKEKGRKLRDLIPGVRSFVVIGDIALVSPKKDVNKVQLFQAIKQLEPKVRAVYIRRKVSGELRINELELAGGEPTTETVYKENGLLFYVDISKVYVNVTLASERAKLSRNICVEKPGKLLDAFTGYGPIAITVAKRGCYVVAGDLNLDGLYMAQKSARLNKVQHLDLVQYDAHHLPFRDKAFDITIADNPTKGHEFKDEICRVSSRAVFYELARSEKEAEEKIGKTRWLRVNEYSKDLFVFKGLIACDDISS